MQFDISNVDLQNKILSKATDADSVQLHQCSIISPIPNKTDNETATKTSCQQKREFADSNDDNRTSKDGKIFLEDPP